MTRDLYQMFRDCVLDDAINHGVATFISQGGRRFLSPLKYLPNDSSGRKSNRLHVGRVQTMGLIRKFMERAAAEFPDGFICNRSGLSVDEAFIEFIKTHRAMGSDHDAMVKAWRAMRSMNDQR